MPAGVNTIRMWRSGALADTLFLWANYRDHRFQRHFHEEFAIGIIEDGCQAFSYDGRHRIDLPRGTVCLISPGMVHEGWVGAEEGWTYRMFYPSAPLMGQAAEEIFGTPDITFPSPAVNDPNLFACLQRLHQMTAAPHLQSLEFETLYLATIRITVERHAGRRPQVDQRRHEPALRQVRDALEDRYAEVVTLSELKELAGISKFHLLRQFKAIYGLPPHAYLSQVRVRRASALILTGHGLADTAAAVGFVDQAHMTHTFRRSLGYTPGMLLAANGAP
ncbi:AraC family transcriptional regulator [Pararhizobium sp. YC-54]|uniref:AraC family transcriptional regulator n=1 Tax=Pararhizobium sp. YC-54 TaxID=2986920 RepID=UPI0021F6BB34|nr:AraC family transcriptional regulator [Pararhizobium sp. YC-54]MCV9999429.1 AraC family transcriptional regulator [Pararhizobium sp. YC-54]